MSAVSSLPPQVPSALIISLQTLPWGCAAFNPKQPDPCSVCTLCGNVLDEAAFATDVTFTKGPGGESAVDGQRVSEAGVARGMGRIAGGRVYGHQVRRRLLCVSAAAMHATLCLQPPRVLPHQPCLRTRALHAVLLAGIQLHAAAVQFDSHEKSLARGKTEIQLLVSQLNIRPRDDMTEAAHRLYRLALQRNFTRGRRTNQVTTSTASLHACVTTAALHAVARSAGTSPTPVVCVVQVAAACLYIVCRQDEKPYMLIDFSDALQARDVPVSFCIPIN